MNLHLTSTEAMSGNMTAVTRVGRTFVSNILSNICFLVLLAFVVAVRQVRTAIQKEHVDFQILISLIDRKDFLFNVILMCFIWRMYHINVHPANGKYVFIFSVKTTANSFRFTSISLCVLLPVFVHIQRRNVSLHLYVYLYFFFICI